MKLSTKFFLIILSVAIIPLILVGYLNYLSVSQETTKNVLDKINAIAQIQKDHLQEHIREGNSLISLFNTRILLKSNINAYNINPSQETIKNIDSEILAAKNGTNNIERIDIVNLSGKIISSTDASLVGKSVANENFFKQGIKENNVSFFVKNIKTNKIAPYLVAPLVLNDKIIGMTAIVISSNDILNLVNDYTGLGKTGEALLVEKNESGDALFLTNVRFDNNSALSRVVKKDQTRVPAVNAANGREVIMADAVDYRGVPVFASTKYIASTGWGVVVKIDKSEALEPLNAQRGLYLFTTIIFILFIGIISFVISILVTNPIIKLSIFAKKVTEGDLSQAIDIKSDDELGNFSRSLNAMVQSLRVITVQYKNLNLNLEKEVNDKTARLNEQNTFLTDANKAMLNLSEDLGQEKDNLEIAKTNNDAVIANIGDALIATDKNGVITIVNGVAEDMFGYKASELMGKPISEKIILENEEGKVLSAVQEPFYISASKKLIVKATYKYLREDKSSIIIAITSSPIVLENNIIGAVNVFRDITKEREIDKAKTEFVSLASHQLRTPATAIKWYSEMLLDKKTGKLTKKQEEYLKQVYYGNERMVRLISNLLNVSRIELGKIIPKNELVDIKQVLKNVIDEQEQDIINRKHKITIKQPKESLVVLSDPIFLKIIFQNFISNAIKYTLNGGKIICALEKGKSKIIFSVTDNGIGIPTTEQKRIFEKLFRAAEALSMDREGNGLGLYIGKKIAEVMGGKIWFESEEGKGSTFYFELPIKSKG